MVSAEAKAAFWDLVAACLEHFHGFSEHEAHRRAAHTRRRIESLGSSGTIVYHAEPFHLAEDIAGKQIPLQGDIAQRYDELIEQFGW